MSTIELHDERSICSEEMIAQYALDIKAKAHSYVEKQVGNLRLHELEKAAITRLHALPHDKRAIEDIEKKLTGIYELLESGQTTFILQSEYLKQSTIAFSELLSFAIATEIMMYITFVFIADSKLRMEFIRSHQDHANSLDRKPLSFWVNPINNASLKSILRDYRAMRNIAAHTFHLISIEAAQSFVLRTYENIERLELIINPARN